MRDFLKREPVKRAIRTFAQAAAGYIVVHVTSQDFQTANTWKALAVAAIAAGIAAAMNIEIDEDRGNDDE